MKRLLSLVLACVLVLSLAACDSAKEPETTAPSAPETTAPATQPTFPQVENPVTFFSLSMGENYENIYSITVFANDDGSAHVEYVGEVRKIGDMDASAFFGITEALANTGLAELNGQDAWNEGEANGSMYIEYADGTMLACGFGGTLPEAYVEGYNTMEEVEAELTRFFTELDSHYNTAPSDYTGTTGKVINLISKKYMEPDLSVEMICDCLGKSRSYLSRMFKENTGMNLLDYLHTTRLTEAKKLLNETDLGISEIAAKVGYYSGWTLARVFKRYEGITPTAYRKAFCNTTEG